MQLRIDNTHVKPFVFVLMPFHSNFDDIYEVGIKAACLSADTDCARVDEQIFVENILERVYNQIAGADIIVSEMTGRNPNVLYETGYAHALRKCVIPLTQNVDDIPFDLKHYPHIIYNPKDIDKLKTELARSIRWFIDNPITDVVRRVKVLSYELEKWKELHNLLNSLYMEFVYCDNEAKNLYYVLSESKLHRRSSAQRVIELFSHHWVHCKNPLNKLHSFGEGLEYMDFSHNGEPQSGPKWWITKLSEAQQKLDEALRSNKGDELVEQSDAFSKLIDDYLLMADGSLKKVVQELNELHRSYP